MNLPSPALPLTTSWHENLSSCERSSRINWKGGVPICMHLASFPDSPLAPLKSKNGGGEPGINLHVILRHNAIVLTNNLKRHSREDREVAAWYYQVRSLLLQLILCCVAVCFRTWLQFYLVHQSVALTK